jgi:hypothetical protein
VHIGYKKEYIEERVNTKFLGLQIDNHPNWMNSIEQMIPKFSRICLPNTYGLLGSTIYASTAPTKSIDQ